MTTARSARPAAAPSRWCAGPAATAGAPPRKPTTRPPGRLRHPPRLLRRLRCARGPHATHRLPHRSQGPRVRRHRAARRPSLSYWDETAHPLRRATHSTCTGWCCAWRGHRGAARNRYRRRVAHHPNTPRLVVREGPPTLYGRFDLLYDGSGRRRCWSTTPTPRPRWSRRASSSGTGWSRPAPTRTSGTACTSGWSAPGPRSAPAARPAGARVWSNEEESGEDQITAGYLAETARQAGLDVTLHADPAGRLGRPALRRRRRPPGHHLLQALPVGVDAGRAVRAGRRSTRAPRPPGSSRPGSCCCRTRRCWRCSGSCTRATSTCSRRTWIRRAA